jgi:hypothetical protein
MSKIHVRPRGRLNVAPCGTETEKPRLTYIRQNRTAGIHDFVLENGFKPAKTPRGA